MPNFRVRSLAAELMETEACAFDDYRACLRDLERVNKATLAYRPTLTFLDRLADSGRLPGDRPVKIIDVGSGRGDLVRRIDRWAARRGIAVELTGLDKDPRATRAAQLASEKSMQVRWVTADIFTYREPRRFDLVVSSLFAHHLDETSLVRFLAWMEATAELGWFVNDLHRHMLPYLAFMTLSRIVGWHRFVRHDGPISIARAFTPEDWRRLVFEAGIPADACAITWWMPFRICVARLRGDVR
jgi:2-polyprenyl-3-methyl-5-hydroxy-6-metoxy-1,4-benzoquinol methylase